MLSVRNKCVQTGAACSILQSPCGDSFPFMGALIVSNVPHLKGEVSAKRTDGFINEESGGTNLWPTDSCSVWRQRVEPGPARPAAAGGSRQRRTIICGEIRRFEEISRSNLWRLISCSVWQWRVGVGSAEKRFPENPGKPKTPGASIYGSQGRVLPRGSKCMQALPTGLKTAYSFSARMALSTAMIITPTSAKMATHMLARPTAVSARQANFTISEKTMF